MINLIERLPAAAASIGVPMARVMKLATDQLDGLLAAGSLENARSEMRRSEERRQMLVALRKVDTELVRSA